MTKPAMRSAAELLEATATGKNKTRVAALAALTKADPTVAERVALLWLAPSAIGDPRSFALVTGAVVAAGELGTRACLDRLARIALDGLPEYGAFHSRAALAATKGPEAATAIAAALTDDAFRDDVACAVRVMNILVDRGEVGDRERVAAIARDAPRLGRGRDLTPEMQAHWAQAIAVAAEQLLRLPATSVTVGA